MSSSKFLLILNWFLSLEVFATTYVVSSAYWVRTPQVLQRLVHRRVLSVWTACGQVGSVITCDISFI